MSDIITEKVQDIRPAVHSAPDKLSDVNIARRFRRQPLQPQAVIYEETRDPGYLHQYYRLREQMFINVWGLKNFSGKVDEYDDQSEIIVARIGNQCIGGCRLTFSAPDDHMQLPMEKEGLELTNHFKELNLDNILYAEISRLAILPEYQNSFVMLELIRQMIKRGATKRARYAFTLSPVPLARNYRKASSLFGLKWDIRSDIAIPDREEYEGIRMVLSVLDLTPIYNKKAKTVVSHSDESVIIAVP